MTAGSGPLDWDDDHMRASGIPTRLVHTAVTGSDEITMLTFSLFCNSLCCYEALQNGIKPVSTPALCTFPVSPVHVCSVSQHTL